MADHGSRGVICGLTLESGENALARLYLAAVQGIAYQTRQIIEKMNANGHKVSAGTKLILSNAFQNASCTSQTIRSRDMLPLLDWFPLVPHVYN
jgi:glycerol kinase